MQNQISQIDFTWWPFKYINGHQTDQSKALETNKNQHKPEKPSLDDMEDAPW